MKKENLEDELNETKERLENLEKANKKTNPVISILVGIVFVVIGFVIGYGISSYLFEDENVDEGNKTEEKENDKEKEESDKDNDEKTELEKLDVNSAVVKELFEIFKEDNCLEKDIFNDLNTSVDARMYLAYRELSSSDFKEMKCGSLNDSYVNGNYCAVNDEAYKYYGSNESKFQAAIANEKTKVVSASVLEAKYKEIFGQDASYKNVTFKLLEGPIAYYDSKNNVYAYFSCECGGDCGTRYIHKLDTIEQSGTTLKLNTTLTVDGSKKTVVYTFKFEKTTGNYVFVSRTEEVNENSISQDLLDDLERKVVSSNFLSLSMVLGNELFDGNSLSSIYALNKNEYEYMAYLTYNYYLEKTGNTANKWSSKDSSYGPCFEQGQNGYCYAIDKSEILKYDKMLFNIGENLLLNGDGFALLKGNKFYVTDIPYLGGNIDSSSMVDVVSVEKNADNTITYIATWNYKLTGGKPAKNINIKFTFKSNGANDYYLYSAERA